MNEDVEEKTKEKKKEKIITKEVKYNDKNKTI